MKSNDIFDHLESQVQTYARTFPCTLDRALGSRVFDVNGRSYLDFLAGAGSLNYGHNNPVLKEALIEYISRDAITHSLDLHTVAKQKFLTALSEVLFEPRGLDFVVQFTGPTGTNAVEAAMKLARKITGRTNIISFTNGFHGVSIGALAATGNKHHRGAAGVPLFGTMVMPYERYLGEDFDTLGYLDKLIGDASSGVDTPAAVIVETVQGEGGINAASAEWLQRLEALCRKREMLLIVDDIQSGCGRTGTFFSFEDAGIKPDLVTVSKSISGYGLPFAILLIKRELDKWRPGEHNGTFRGNNHAFVTATVALEHYWRTDTFANEVRAKGEFLGERLQTLVDQFSPHLVEVRGRGMMRGILCADADRAAAVTKNAFELGLIIERAGPDDEVIKFLMPLTTTREELDEGLRILERALDVEYGDATLGSPEWEARIKSA